MPEPQQLGIQAVSSTYTTAHSNAWCLTHWARPRIEPGTSWFLVGFINHWAKVGTPIFFLILIFIYFCCCCCCPHFRLEKVVIGNVETASRTAGEQPGTQPCSSSTDQTPGHVPQGTHEMLEDYSLQPIKRSVLLCSPQHFLLWWSLRQRAENTQQIPLCNWEQLRALLWKSQPEWVLTTRAIFFLQGAWMWFIWTTALVSIQSLSYLLDAVSAQNSTWFLLPTRVKLTETA